MCSRPDEAAAHHDEVDQQEAGSGKEGNEIAMMHTLGEKIGPVIHTPGARSLPS